MGRIIELCETIRAILLFAADVLLPFPTKKQDEKAKLLHIISSRLFTSLSSAAVLKRCAPPCSLLLFFFGWVVFNVDCFPKVIHQQLQCHAQRGRRA